MRCLLVASCHSRVLNLTALPGMTMPNPNPNPNPNLTALPGMTMQTTVLGLELELELVIGFTLYQGLAHTCSTTKV